ncbi:hypothetical protein ABIC89_002483 [Variovorax boronicumulans]
MRDAQDHGERWHVLTAFDLAHMGSFDAGLIRQSFLSNAIRCSECSHDCAKRKGGLGLKCRCP